MLYIVGRIHPVLVHFPIVLFLLALALELYRWRRRSGGRYSKGLLLLATVSAVLTAIVGQLLALSGRYEHELLRGHQIAGFAGAGLAVATFALRKRGAYRALLLLTTLLVCAAAFVGARIHYGESYFLGASPVAGKPSVAAFESSVRPILERNCMSCHGGNRRLGGLALDDAFAILEGGEFGPAVVPGSKEQSPLYQRIMLPVFDKKHMPANRGMLSSTEIALIGKWIDEGAFGPEATAQFERLPRRPPARALAHWSFQDFSKPPVPQVKDAGWALTPIDSFVLAKLEKQGLRPAAETSRERLARRASFGLTGLPPLPGLVHELAALSPAAFETRYRALIDQQLGRPQFGEKWARHWLDLAKYADSSGYEEDPDVDGAYHYRDYVIRAFNSDLPFDKFLSLQVAGDKLAPGDKQALAATGFLTLGPAHNSGADGDLKQNLRWQEMMSTTVSASLGLDMSCAKCHNHKYEPISKRSYFEMLVPFIGVANTPLDSHGFEKLRKDLEKQFKAGINDARYQTALRAHLDKAPIIRAERTQQVDETDILVRDQIRTSSGKASFRLLNLYENAQSSPDFWREKIVRRKGRGYAVDKREILAEWLTDTRDGVGKRVARLAVDHIWRNHFGTGLMPTPDNWGVTGGTPSHRELLDWLAFELIESNWSAKHIHKLIVSSRVYRLGASTAPDALAGWKGYRLPAELVRDAVLATSGNLNLKMFGPSIMPPVNSDFLARSRDMNWEQKPKPSPEDFRRSIYVHRKRNLQFPTFELLNAADPYESVHQRAVTMTPLQALHLLNDGFFSEQANNFARSLRESAGPDARAQVTLAYESALSRPPRAEELSRALRFLGQASNSLASLCRVIFSLNEFIYVD